MFGIISSNTTKHEINSIIRNITDIAVSPTTQEYFTGNYIIYNKQLYKVKSNLPVGTTLEIGSNIELTTIGEELQNSTGGGTTIVQMPSVYIEDYYYDGQTHGPTILSIDNSRTTVINSYAIDLGDYVMTISLKDSDSMVWSDLTNAPKTYTYSITKRPILIPTVNIESYQYTGSSQGPTIIDLAADYVDVTGETATAVGEYTLTLSLKYPDITVWSDNTVADLTYGYVINKATQILTPSPSVVNVGPQLLTDTVNISQVGDGTLSITNSSSSIATATFENNVITITSVGSGDTTITITATETVNYTEASITITVHSYTYGTFNATTWVNISKVARAGGGQAVWAVGDCKSVKLNGTVGTLSLSSKTLYVYIIGFNHNQELEGVGISLAGFKSALTSGKNVGLVDQYVWIEYGDSTYTDGKKAFNMNHQRGVDSANGHNYGGWKGCDLRYDILGGTNVAPSNYVTTNTKIASDRVGYDATSTCASSPVSSTLMAALPSDFRAVLQPMTKYSDNVGNHNGTSSSDTSCYSPEDISASIDYISLLSQCEIYGSLIWGNPYELNMQAQYSWFMNGNDDRVRYKHSSTSTQISGWWTRSIGEDNTKFITAEPGAWQGPSLTSSKYSLGLCPIFLV